MAVVAVVVAVVVVVVVGAAVRNFVVVILLLLPPDPREPASRFSQIVQCSATTQNLALTPRGKQASEVLFPNCFPLGVVVRFRSVFTEHITLRPYEQLLGIHQRGVQSEGGAVDGG